MRRQTKGAKQSPSGTITYHLCCLPRDTSLKVNGIARVPCSYPLFKDLNLTLNLTPGKKIKEYLTRFMMRMMTRFRMEAVMAVVTCARARQFWSRDSSATKIIRYAITPNTVQMTRLSCGVWCHDVSDMFPQNDRHYIR